MMPTPTYSSRSSLLSVVSPIAEIAQEVHARADSSRECFKRLRAETRHEAGNLTPQQMYGRRLANNCKSAAVSHVYAEFLREEPELIAEKVADRVKRYEDHMQRVEKQITEVQEEMSYLLSRVLILAARHTSNISASTNLHEQDKHFVPTPPSAPTLQLSPIARTLFSSPHTKIYTKGQ